MPEDQAPTTGPVAATAAELRVTPLSPPGYELIDQIGHGGMGVVYRARDSALGRDVAVKLLSERYPADAPAAQRFLSEARITGQLQHPGIPAVHQVGTLADGRPFLAMKLIKGSTLEAILKQRADPATDRGPLLAIFESICQAVGYAHAHRVIHRDLKPANVMVGAFGEVQAKGAADVRRAVELWGKARNLNTEVRFELASALAVLAGLGGDAKSGVTKDEAKTFADQSVTALAAAVKAGWAVPRELKEPDFDALRNRADFRKLLAEVEARSGPKARPGD
jgi:serine/threonine protein kinase